MKKNKFSINYIYTENNVGDFTKIYKFFGPSFDIKIGLLAGSEEDGFSEKTFWQIVIDSFNFK